MSNRSKRRAFDAAVKRWPSTLTIDDHTKAPPGFRALWCVRVDQGWELDHVSRTLNPPHVLIVAAQ